MEELPPKPVKDGITFYRYFATNKWLGNTTLDQTYAKKLKLNAKIIS
jgi:hypothetical protein